MSVSNKTKKIALITGVTGQDGAYLAEFLLKNYFLQSAELNSSDLLT